MNFRQTDDSRREKATDVIRRMWELPEHDSHLQHPFGPGGIFTDDEFKQA